MAGTDLETLIRQGEEEGKGPPMALLSALVNWISEKVGPPPAYMADPIITYEKREKPIWTLPEMFGFGPPEQPQGPSLISDLDPAAASKARQENYEVAGAGPGITAPAPGSSGVPQDINAWVDEAVYKKGQPGTGTVDRKARIPGKEPIVDLNDVQPEEAGFVKESFTKHSAAGKKGAELMNAVTSDLQTLRSSKMVAGPGVPVTTIPPSGAPEPGLAEKLIAEQDVPELKLTPKMEFGKKAIEVAEAAPKTVEELAGQRPGAPKRSFLEQFLLGAMRGTAGINPVEEENRIQAIRDQQYMQNVAVAKERMNKIMDVKFKVLENELLENRAEREDQKKQYAELGKINPLLAKNPKYIAGLFFDLPEDVRQRLIKASIDPVTGLFKPGASLYFPPQLEQQLQIESYANLVKQLEPGLSKDEAIRKGIEFKSDPAGYLAYGRDAVKKLQNEILDLSKQPKTAMIKAQIEDKEALLDRLRGHERSLNEIEKFVGIQKEFANMRQRALDDVVRRYPKSKLDPTQNPQDANEIRKQNALASAEIDQVNKMFENLIRMHQTQQAGGATGVATEWSRASENKQKVSNDPVTRSIWRLRSDTDPNIHSGALPGQLEQATKILVNQASSMPPGTNIDEKFAWNSVPNDQASAYNDLIQSRIQLAGGGYSNELANAGKRFASANKGLKVDKMQDVELAKYIPLRNVLNAYDYVLQQLTAGKPVDKVQVQNFLEAGAPVSTKK